MKRGKLLDFQGQTIQFDSRLQEFSVPIDRVARVVDVSANSRRQSAIGSQKEVPPHENSRSLTPGDFQRTEVRVTLTDGSMLIFEPLEVKDGQLIGRSSVYGEVSVPVSSIEYLYFGEKAKAFKAAFEKWNIRPAKEPAYND